MNDTPLAEMDRLWEEAKRLERGHNGRQVTVMLHVLQELLQLIHKKCG